MSYRFVATATTVILLALFVVYRFMPASLLESWGIAATPEAAFMAGRVAPAFLGMAVACWLSRALEPSAARRALAFGIATTFAAVAVIGLYELATGFASTGILTAVAVEVALALAFVITGRHTS